MSNVANAPSLMLHVLKMKLIPILGIIIFAWIAPKSSYSEVKPTSEIERKIVIGLSSNTSNPKEKVTVTIVIFPDRLRIWEEGYSSRKIEIPIKENQYLKFERYIAKAIANNALKVLDGKSKKELNHTHCFIDIVSEERLLGGFNIFDKESFEEIIDKLPGSGSSDFPASKINQVLEKVGAINSEAVASP